MPISQLTQSPKDWEKYKKKFRKIGLIRSIYAWFSGLFAKKDKNFWLHLIKAVIVLVIVMVLLGGIALVAAYAWYSRDLPDPNKVIDRVINQSTKIYDRTGQVLLWEIHGDQKRTVVELDQISPNVINATIAAEDKTFWTHHGFKITSILRSIFVDLFSGKKAQGGSTITQQFVKNAILTNEKSFTRKFKELILSYEIENKFTKEQILKLYFNEIPYGSVNYGVESAANYYFGKHAKDVTLGEAAILAALPQAPTRYSPYGTHVNELFARQNWILDEMVKDGYISKDQASAAKAEKITFRKEELGGIIAPHFVFYVKDLLAQQLGDQALEQGGLNVITTLDADKQKLAEQALADNRDHNLKYQATNAALVSLDAKSGQILAMVGSQDYNDNSIDGQVNVTIMPRQPGSSIKPVVYASAFEKGFTTETVLYDVDTVFPVQPKPYAPQDYDKKERGPLTMRQALAGSLNIPAVKTLYLAGIDNVKSIMQNLGYSTITDKTQCGLSLTLGGCEVTLLDHADAFTAFAQDGERAEAAAILKVTDKDGNVLDEFQEKKHKSWSENTARQINSILSDNNARAYIFGANSPLILPDRPVCAKTGTTNDNNDAWTIGYTPSYVTGVWVGNNNGDNMTGNADGVNVAAPIWHEYMANILANTPVETFTAPDPLPDTLQPILRGIIPANQDVAIDRASGKLATPLTPASFVVMKKFNQNHDILYYVNKDDPQGPPPADPAADPMFQPWEDAVKAWVAKQPQNQNVEISTDVAPTEYDDLHVPANTPTITLISPTDNQTINSFPVHFSAQASAPRGINRVAYEVDGQVVGVATSSPYTLDLTSLDVSAGYHKVKATAYDDIDNSASQEINANFMLPNSGTGVEINWISPRQNSSFYASVFPLGINFSLPNYQNAQKISLYYSSQGSGSETKLGDIYNILPDQMNVNWTQAPPSGSYELYAKVTDQAGNESTSNKLLINILQ